MYWQAGRFLIDLSRPKIMGIVNVTPDSFFDGGRYLSHQDAINRCKKLVDEGTDILDIGAESTRPNAPALSEQEELDRLLPVLNEAVKLGVAVSVDTYHPSVMKCALESGADIINDVWALRWALPGKAPEGLSMIAKHQTCGICLMHMHLEPTRMQIYPMDGVVKVPVTAALHERVKTTLNHGVAAQRICIDPGIGFGKTEAQNFELLRDFCAQCENFELQAFPKLLGFSRKSSLLAVANREVKRLHPNAGLLGNDDLLTESLAAAILGVSKGFNLVRVHDVGETRKALSIFNAML